MRRIGFQLAALEKTIKEVPPETKKLSSGLKEVAGQNTLVASATEKYSSAQEKFTQATNLAKLAIGGEVTLLGALRLALIATGLGALVVVLGSVVVFLTKTAEGTKLVENVMAQVGAVVNVVIDRLGTLGKAVVQVLSGEFSAAANTAAGAFRGIGDEIEREVKLAGDLSKARQQLDRDTANNIDTNKRLLNEVERLKNVRDNEFNTLAQRKKANEDAFKVELQRETTLADLARRRIAILKAEIDQRGGERKVSLEQLREYKEAQNELSDIQEDAAGKQNELITNRFQLSKEGLDKEKEAAAATAEQRIALRREALALEAQVLARQLAQVQQASDQELSLLQQKLRNGYQAELNVKNLTAGAKRVIDEKYEGDSLALSLDFNRRRLLAALQTQVDITAGELASQQQGGEQALRLQTQQIENQRRLALAGLNANADNTARVEAINAAAAQQRRQAEYADATRLLNEYLNQQRQAIELAHANGLTAEGTYQQQLATLREAGTQAQTVINTDYQQSNAENQKQAAEDEIAAARLSAAQVQQAEQAKQQIREATLQSAQAYTDTLITLFGEETEAGKAALALKKVLAIAEIAMNLAKQLSANQLASAGISTIPVIGPPLAAAYLVAANIAAVTAAAASTATVLRLQRGGIAYGPSHDEGGIPLFYRGRSAGIEIEGGEPVLTRRVSQMPHLLAAASAVNVAAGGAPLIPNNFMALGGIASPLVRNALRGESIAINYERLAQATAQATAQALRANPPVTRISDIKSGFARDADTQALSDA